MEEGRPSRTAFAAALHRAAHQIVDRPILLHDPHAGPILGPEAVERLKTPPDPVWAASQALMRALIVARLLFAEETLAAAVKDGLTQYVVLGAGLDTFAYRNPFPQVRVFEVDFPATGDWKQRSLAQAGIAIPANVTYAPMDFETETLRDGLARAGFDLSRPAIFAWLGVVPYLTKDTIFATLKAVASLPAGTQIIFDYGEPRETLPAVMQAYMAERMKALEAIGEPWLSFFNPSDLATQLRATGFSEIEDLNGGALNARWYADRTDGLRSGMTAHVLRAKV